MFVMTTLGQLTDQLPGAINQRELFNCLPEGSFCVLFRGLKVSKKVFFQRRTPNIHHLVQGCFMWKSECKTKSCNEDEEIIRRSCGLHTNRRWKNLKSKLHWPSFFLPTDDIWQYGPDDVARWRRLKESWCCSNTIGFFFSVTSF